MTLVAIEATTCTPTCTETVSDARKVGAGAFETVLSYFVEEEVVGRKEQPRSGPPQHEARPAAAVLWKCSPP